LSTAFVPEDHKPVRRIGPDRQNELLGIPKSVLVFILCSIEGAKPPYAITRDGGLLSG